jgi:HEAT repeat protein
VAAELQNPGKYVRIRALNILALQGKKSAPVFAAVKALQSDPDGDVQRAAGSALVSIGE